MKKLSLVCYTDNSFIYGKDLFDDGSVIPWMKPVDLPTKIVWNRDRVNWTIVKQSNGVLVEEWDVNIE